MQSHQVQLSQVRDGRNLNEGCGNRNGEKEQALTSVSEIKATRLEAGFSSGEERKVTMTLRVSLGRLGE